MNAQEIEEEINQYRAYIASLQGRLRELQQNCDHHFQRDLYFEKCLKCNKVNVLYY